MQSPHGRVPPDPALHIVGTVLLGEAFAHLVAQNIRVKNGECEKPPEHDDGDYLRFDGGEEGRNNDRKHHGDEELSKAQAGIHKVAHPLALGPFIAKREISFLAAGETVAGLIPLHAQALPLFFSRVCHQGTLTLRFPLLAAGRWATLAHRLRIGLTGGGVRHVTPSIIGCWPGQDLKITRMAHEFSPTAHPDHFATLSEGVASAGVEHLASLIRIPSLSLPSAPDGPVDDSARVVRDLFAPLMEWDVVDIVRAPGGRPAVMARKNPAPGFPTVLLYAHHDVQPAGDSDQWDSDPFEASIRNGRLYGRGSADDGAGIITHWQALSYLAAAEPEGSGLGIVVFIEGEEESGSPTFTTLLESHRDTLQADVIIVADSDNPSPTTPALTTSLRGVVGLTVSVKTAEFPVHSGMFGGVVPDAPTALIRLLATLHDDQGTVTLPFALPKERAKRAWDEVALRREVGMLPGVDLVGQGTVSDRLWWAPAITVTGFDAPQPEQASNTLWPSARARVSMRIPPHAVPQEAASALVQHLESHAPWGVHVSVSDLEMGPGFVGGTDTPSSALYAQCATEVFGEPLQCQGVGGTIPFISQLAQVFPDATVLVTGVEDQESRAHGVNESVDVEMLKKTGITEALFLLRLSQLR